MDINYKELDRKAIMDYIANNGGTVSVEDIINNSGAEKLRVYSILFEEKLEKNLEVIEEGYLGAPKVVKLIKS